MGLEWSSKQRVMIPGSPVVLVNEQDLWAEDAANLGRPGTLTTASPQLLLWAAPRGSILQPLNSLLTCVQNRWVRERPPALQRAELPGFSSQNAKRMAPFSMCAKVGKRLNSTAPNRPRREHQSPPDDSVKSELPLSACPLFYKALLEPVHQGDSCPVFWKQWQRRARVLDTRELAPPSLSRNAGGVTASADPGTGASGTGTSPAV